VFVVVLPFIVDEKEDDRRRACQQLDARIAQAAGLSMQAVQVGLEKVFCAVDAIV
jgi:hypothetical protein